MAEFLDELGNLEHTGGVSPRDAAIVCLPYAAVTRKFPMTMQARIGIRPDRSRFRPAKTPRSGNHDGDVTPHRDENC
jgi:hypothetical protein